MAFFYKIVKTDTQIKIPFKKKLPFEEEDSLPTLIDESLLQEPPLDFYKLDSVDISIPILTDDSLFDAFEKALEKYVNLDPESFFQLYNLLPTLKKTNGVDFLNVNFEDLFKIPVRVKKADITMIKTPDSGGSSVTIAQVIEDDDFNNTRTLSESIPTSTIFINQNIPDGGSEFIPYVPPVPDSKPTTPSITLNSQNTLNMNREALILSQEGSMLTGNVFDKGASFGNDGGNIISLSFFQPVRPGSTMITNIPGQIIIVTPEQNSMILYTTTTVEHRLGDFEYNLIAPIFTPPQLFLFLSGSKVFVDKFRYTLTDNDGDASTGTIQVQIVDDVPTATPKANEVNETLYFVNGSETATGNLVYDNDGFGPSSFGADGGFVSRVNGVTTIVGDTITAATTYGEIVVYANNAFPFDAGDYVYTLDGTKTSPVNDALLEIDDVITYRLTDNDGNIASSTLTITITLNQPPQAVDDNYSVSEDQILSVDDISGVLANDVVSPGDTKAVSEVNGNALDVGVQVNLPSGALLTLQEDGSFDYDPNGLVNGQTDDFTYTLIEAEGLTSQADVHIDILLPLIFDLSNQGFKFIALEDSSTTWTINGQQHTVAWCAPEQGVLIYDENQNGLVDSIQEFAFNLYDLFAKTDLEGLKVFDTDKNNLLDENDVEFAKFSMWLDFNADGKSDQGELLTLKDLGIKAIALESDGQYRVIDDTLVFGQGQFYKEDGTTGAFLDTAFKIGEALPESWHPMPANPLVEALTLIPSEVLL